MTEVEQARDVFTQSHSPIVTDSHSHAHSMTSPSKRDRHRHNRHTVHNPHNAHSSHKRHRAHHNPSSPRRGKRALPPGWEEVQSEGGMYYWHKKTGKTTWKFPSTEAKEHKRKQQSHTYINIRPGQRPQVMKSEDSDRESSPTASGHSSRVTTQVNGSGSERSREGDGVGRREQASNDGVFQTEAGESGADMWTSGEAEMNGALSSPGDESGVFPSPPSGRRRPLVVHNYENFPFNPTAKTPPGNSEATPNPVLGGGSGGASPTRSRAESNASSASSAPPLPERHYSESDINWSSPAPNYPAPSPGQEDHESRDSLSPLHHGGRGQSRSHEVQREVSEQGSEYAVINPAWRKNVKGRSPSLTRITDPHAAEDGAAHETPPPLPNRPSTLGAAREDDATGFVGLDSDLVQRTREELDVSSRFVQSVRYVDVELSGKSRAEGSRGNRSKVGAGFVTYDTIDFPKSQPEGTAGDEERRQGGQARPGGGQKRNERWLKTQSAHITSSHTTSTSSPPPPHPHQTTPTPDSTHHVGGNRRLSPTKEEEKKEAKKEAVPVIPPKLGLRLGNEDFSENSRRLHAMNVTLRRPSESEGEKSRQESGMKLSKEALLLRSGVTLRPGTRPPRPPSLGEEGGGEGERGGSGTDEEDGLEPVTRAIKSLETKIVNHPPHLPAGGGGGGGGGGREGKANLALIPDGPPKWTQYQRPTHKYEDIEILDDQLMDGIPGSKKGSLRCGQNSARSVGNLHMAWDESDIRSQPAMVKPADMGGGKGSQLVSASQPCLVDMSTAFPHLVKPNRVSDHAFQLRKLRLLQHKYEDIEIPEWPEVGGVPGSVTSVGDVPSPAVRNSWLEADKESAVTDSGTILPKGWQRMTDEQNRAYYWHIPTGRTQYTKPTGVNVETLALSLDDSSQPLSDQSDHSVCSSSSGIPRLAAHSQSEVKGHSFSARYLGSHPVEESELVPGECVKVVHASIRRTNSSPNAKGRLIFLVIRGMELQWMESESSSPTTIQPINRIRVWGIGLENDRDFGYVARDQVTKKHKCHVFRCDMPARAVAKALLENHQKQAKTPPATTPTGAHMLGRGEGGKENETSQQNRSGSPEVPVSHERTQTVSQSNRGRGLSPPAGDGESMETVNCVYMGSCEVLQSQGIDILNAAVEKLLSNKSRWTNASVSISTSSIKITDSTSDRTVGDHKIRYLCFLGIAKNDRYCGYILESSARSRRQPEKRFLFHGFKMEPNTDKLCLALHTACQTRYQKVLEANPEAQRAAREKAEAERLRSKSTSSILGRLGSFKKNKREDDCKVFKVQYLGSQQVAKSEGLEVVKGPIQQLSIPKSAVGTTPVNLVDFEVSPAGLGVTDPNKKLFSKKNFSVKHITYVVRIRNYFAFVVRDGAKYQCYVFLETGVPAATIVTTIQRMLAPEPSKKR